MTTPTTEKPQLAVAIMRTGPQTVRLTFSQSITWMDLNPEQAAALAMALAHFVDSVPDDAEIPS